MKKFLANELSQLKELHWDRARRKAKLEKMTAQKQPLQQPLRSFTQVEDDRRELEFDESVKMSKYCRVDGKRRGREGFNSLI